MILVCALYFLLYTDPRVLFRGWKLWDEVRGEVWVIVIERAVLELLCQGFGIVMLALFL